MNKTWDEDDSFKHKTQSGWDLHSLFKMEDLFLKFFEEHYRTSLC